MVNIQIKEAKHIGHNNKRLKISATIKELVHNSIITIKDDINKENNITIKATDIIIHEITDSSITNKINIKKDNNDRN